MNLFLRLFLLVFSRQKASGLRPLDTSITTMRVWPGDLDLFGHVNNGRYLTIMDLGRVDLMLRTGFWKIMRRRRWFPLVGTTLIDYRRPLRPFQRYELHTRILGWDDKWFYIEHLFTITGAVAARATVKAMMREPEGALTPVDALAAIGFAAASPDLPGYVALMDGRERLASA